MDESSAARDRWREAAVEANAGIEADDDAGDFFEREIEKLDAEEFEGGYPWPNL